MVDVAPAPEAVHLAAELTSLGSLVEVRTHRGRYGGNRADWTDLVARTAEDRFDLCWMNEYEKSTHQQFGWAQHFPRNGKDAARFADWNGTRQLWPGENYRMFSNYKQFDFIKDVMPAVRRAAPNQILASVQRLLNAVEGQSEQAGYAEAATDLLTAAAPNPARRQLVAVSQWVNASLEGRSKETIDLLRTMKVAEEAGEVIRAVISWTGANPRKDHIDTVDKVVEELLDTAMAALGAVEHLTNHEGRAFDLLNDRIRFVAIRAGVEPTTEEKKAS